MIVPDASALQPLDQCLRAIALVRTRDDLYQALTKLARLLSVNELMVGRFRNRGALVEWIFGSGINDANDWAGQRWSCADFPILERLNEGAVISSGDPALDSRFTDQEKQSFAAARLGSIGLFPLMDSNGLAGVFAIASEKPNGLDEALLREAATLSAHVGSVLERLVLDETLARYARRASALHQAAKIFGTERDETQLWKRAARALIDDFGFADTTLCAADEVTGFLKEVAFAGASDFPGRVMKDFPIDNPEIKIVRAYLTQDAIEFRDVLPQAIAEGWAEVARAAQLKSAVVVPIVAGDIALGAIGAGQAISEITPEDTTILLTFASQLGLATSRIRADHETQRRMQETEQAAAEQARLLTAVREMSTPVMPVHDGILVVPLVGAIDAARSARLMDVLLAAIQQDGAEVVLIDVTGVPMVDADVADQLLKTAQAASLLGASCILVGISSRVAQTLIHCGVDLSGLVLRNNLRSGILHALSLMSHEVKAKKVEKRLSTNKR